MSSTVLSVCIISYNTSDLTLDAIRSSVLDITKSPVLRKRSEIIVVDNNSSDDSVKIFKQYSKTTDVPIKIIENKENTGFAIANNQAIQESEGTYVLLLNSDAYVQPTALEKLVLAFEEVTDQSTADLASQSTKLDRLGILSACLVNSDGTYQPQGGSYPTLFSLSNHLLFIRNIPIIGRVFPSTQQRESYYPSNESFPKLIKRDWVAGTAMLLRKEMINEIGVLDEKIFMYGEDMEFCVRAKDHHWDVALHPTAFVTHLKSASSSTAKAIEGEFKGYTYIWSKHKPIWQIPLVKLLINLGILLRIVLFDTMNKKDKATIYKNAWKQL